MVVLSLLGLLAVGSTDGLVKVFSLKVTLGSSSSIISGVAQYVLWGDRDELCAQLLEWLPEVNHTPHCTEFYSPINHHTVLASLILSTIHLFFIIYVPPHQI